MQLGSKTAMTYSLFIPALYVTSEKLACDQQLSKSRGIGKFPYPRSERVQWFFTKNQLCR